MAWTKRQTFTVFYIVLAVSIVFMLIYLSCFYNFVKKDLTLFSYSLMSLTVASFGTGYGCLWFRINRGRSPLSIAGHAIWHIMVFATMVFARRFFYEQFMITGDDVKWFYGYNLPIVTYVLYSIQLLLSFHFMIFRNGINPSDMAFRTELHAFGGALIYLYIFLESSYFTCDMYRSRHTVPGMYFATPFYLLGNMFCCLFLLLTPYFEWRRMQNLMKSSRPSKPSISRRSSKTSIRSTSRRSSKSSSRSASRMSLQVPLSSHSAATRQY